MAAQRFRALAGGDRPSEVSTGSTIALCRRRIALRNGHVRRNSLILRGLMVKCVIASTGWKLIISTARRHGDDSPAAMPGGETNH
jgi:hypothetical protein